MQDMKLRSKRREIAEKKAKRRKSLICSLNDSDYINRFLPDELGYFRNNNIANEYIASSQKTKASHGSQTYRHHGVYGKALQYSKHDNIQVSYMDLEAKEYGFKIKGTNR